MLLKRIELNQRIDIEIEYNKLNKIREVVNSMVSNKNGRLLKFEITATLRFKRLSIL